MTGRKQSGKVAAAVTVFALAALMVPAEAGAARATQPNLHVTKVEAPPASLRQGDSVTVKGTVTNRGHVKALAKISATLSKRPAAKKGPARAGRTIVRIGPRSGREFQIAGEVPAWLNPGKYHLVVCVRKRGERGRLACKRHKRAMEVTARTYEPGSRSLGDELFPQIGNGGYDAQHYEIKLHYDHLTNEFGPGTATTMQARAKQDLSEFSLDFQDLDVTRVTVDGRPAAFEQVPAPPVQFGGTQPWKLVIVPSRGIVAGKLFQVRVEYQGEPVRITDPDGSLEGWTQACRTAGCDGAFVVNQPFGAQAWFPNNNHPTDKATFDTHITVPEGKVAFGVGELVASEPNGDGTVTWKWSEDDPTATYLTTATNGDFDLEERTITETLTGRALPLYEGIDVTATETQRNRAKEVLAQTEPMINFLSERFGPYPFDSGGAVFDLAPVGYALEVQTKPHFSSLSTSESTLMHEIAHQWFGNAVTLANWNDLWWQEGWATWCSWAWNYEAGSGASPAQQFANNFASSSPPNKWSTIPTELNGNPQGMFNTFPVYIRGAMTYEGYRQIVGDEKFYAFGRELRTRFAYSNVSSEDVVELALEMSGFEGERLKLLEEYFQQWLYEGEEPTVLPESFE